MGKTSKQQILEVAQDLIQKFGVNGMSYKDISEIVGIRKASLHHHFPTKEHLVTELLTQYNQSFFDTVRTIVNSKARSGKKLDKFIALFGETLRSSNQNKLCLCGVLGAEIAALSESSAMLVAEFYRRNEEFLTIILEQGKKEQTFSFAGSSNDLASLIFSLLEGAMLRARVSGKMDDFLRIMSQLKTLL